VSIFFNYETGGKDNEKKLSAEQLLTIFNRNIVKNAELLDYLDKKNYFEVIAKSRNESMHSRLIAELLSGTFFNGDSGESTLIHFLDIILYRAGKEDKVMEVNEHLRRAILTRSVMFEKVDSKCELSIKKYQDEYAKFPTQNCAESDDRIDIYLKFKLLTPIAGRHELEIFIENKVDALEHDSQTKRHFEACDNCGDERPFQLFVYLTPQPLRDMDHYVELNRDMRPECPHYIHICYQDIVDYVIEPLLVDEGLDTDKRTMLREYVSCLELPAMPDSESERQGNELSIMAIGSKEKQLVEAFMEDDVNRWLISKVIEAKLGEAFYSVGGADKLLNSTEALQSALQVIINLKKKPLDILRRVADCNMTGTQNGSGPVLIYSPKHWRHNGFCKYLPLDKLLARSGKAIDNDMFVKLMQCNTQVFINVPVTENALPQEIDDLVDDVTGYQQVGDTDFFYRKDIPGDRILKLNQIPLLRDHDLIEKCEDTSILLEFFNSRKNLVLSVYKILLEAERDNAVYEEKLKIYRKLTKQ
jgi:hypothetical protein